MAYRESVEVCGASFYVKKLPESTVCECESGVGLQENNMSCHRELTLSFQNIVLLGC